MEDATLEAHEQDKDVVLKSPGEFQGPTLLQKILCLLRNVRPGADLTYFQLPPLFNLPQSQLQYFGELVYCIQEDYLSNCNKGNSSLERFLSVVAWSITTITPVPFGKAAFNPILGETHHVSRGSLNVFLEQVSHHPPVSALHATDTNENIEMIWSICPAAKFHGTYAEAVVKGKRKIKLLNFGENYEMDYPKYAMKFLPSIGGYWHGNVHIRCTESNLHADLCYYKSNAFLGFGGNCRSIKGKIFNSQSLEPIYEIHGQWDRIVTLKDVQSGDTQVLYDGKTISKLATPVVKDQKNLWPSESAVVWSDVIHAILNRDWKRASEAKRDVEERERRKQRERKSKEQVWLAKHFRVTHNKGEWECSPFEQTVPPAPIIVPL